MMQDILLQHQDQNISSLLGSTGSAGLKKTKLNKYSYVCVPQRKENPTYIFNFECCLNLNHHRTSSSFS